MQYVDAVPVTPYLIDYVVMRGAGANSYASIEYTPIRLSVLHVCGSWHGTLRQLAYHSRIWTVSSRTNCHHALEF